MVCDAQLRANAAVHSGDTDRSHATLPVSAKARYVPPSHRALAKTDMQVFTMEILYALTGVCVMTYAYACTLAATEAQGHTTTTW